MTSKEWREGIDRVVNTSVRGEVGLDLREEDHRAISASTIELAGKGETNSIVEGQTEGLVDVLTALTVEKIRLQVIKEGEEHAALL